MRRYIEVMKLRVKDDTARLRAAAADAAEARMLGEGSFGRVFLGRDADTGADVVGQCGLSLSKPLSSALMVLALATCAS
jgi:hypothetical protein